MYYIFLDIVAIYIPNHVDHIKYQFVRQIKETKSVKIVEKDKNEDSQPVSQDFVSDEQEDIISLLRKEERDEDKALGVDLESLGLDPVDDTFVSEKIVVSKDNKDNKESFDIENLETKTKEVKKIEVKKAETVKEDLFPKIPLESFKKESGSVEDIVSVKKEESLLEIIQNPIKKIVKIFNTKIQKKDEIKIKEHSKEETEVKTEKEEEFLKKKETIIEAKIIEAKVLSELKEKDKRKKIEKLKQQYLQDDNGFGVRKIIPRQKVIPRFVVDEIPPPLLNRFRGNENKHHPFIMSYSERINFMFKAIKENRNDDFNAIFSLVAQPNIRNKFGDTLLIFATLMRRYDIMSSLVSKGADPDLMNGLGYTPLGIAIEMADYKAAKILINIGNANVNLTDGFGRTYLMQSIRVGSLPITDLLISKGVDVNAVDNYDITALSMAYKYKKDIIAKYLLKSGAKSWIKKNYVEDESSMIDDLFDKWK